MIYFETIFIQQYVSGLFNILRVDWQRFLHSGIPSRMRAIKSSHVETVKINQLRVETAKISQLRVETVKISHVESGKISWIETVEISQVEVIID